MLFYVTRTDKMKSTFLPPSASAADVPGAVNFLYAAKSYETQIFIFEATQGSGAPEKGRGLSLRPPGIPVLPHL